MSLKFAIAKGNESDCIKKSNMEKRIFELTVSEFIDLLKEENIFNEVSEQKAEPTMLYSIKELAEFLKCSVPTAQKIKNSGKIPFSQMGRKVVFNGEDVLSALSAEKKKGVSK